MNYNSMTSSDINNNKFEEFLKIKTEKYSNAYDGKIFKGKVIIYKPPYVHYKENIYYDIFFTKQTNPYYCNLNEKRSGIYVSSN